MAHRIGIDIGGTFTDFAALDDATGRFTIHKQLTTPDDPARSVLTGIGRLMDKAAIGIGDVSTVIHGTTLVTNALIERRGARTAMVCTAGFVDMVDIARERRYDMYDLRIAYPEALVPKPMRIEAAERIDAAGRAVTPLDETALIERVGALLRDRPFDAVAICFINSYANDSHERQAAAAISAAFPELYVSTSADVFPFMREYERWSTTVMNVYTRPMLDRYLGRLETGLADIGFGGDLYLMTSSGGTVAPATARRYPVRLLESGPAGGITLAARWGEVLARPNLLAYDMGGTTAKGALIKDALPLKRYEMEVARVHEFRMGSGLPAKIPVIDMIEIGAGGGSLAAVDDRGAIQVGPHSAGADPGPVCYGRGATQPALSDANLVLGYYSADFFLGGTMALDADAAATAIEDRLARTLNVSTVRAAWGVHETINEDVARAFRNHASERGFDYRRSAMIAFGGSGPGHAARVARKLRVPEVILPAAAGVMSAVGMLFSPLTFEALRSYRVALADLSAGRYEEIFAGVTAEARAALGAGTYGDEIREAAVTRSLDMRYIGQGYDIEVTIPDGLAPADQIAALPGLFAKAYEQVFFKSFPEKPIEIVSWKAELRGPRPATGLERCSLVSVSGATARKGTRQAYFPEGGGYVDCPVYDRYALSAESQITGPALIEENEATCVIGVGDRVTVDGFGNLVVAIALDGTQQEKRRP